jgi:hypothetical protein
MTASLDLGKLRSRRITQGLTKSRITPDKLKNSGGLLEGLGKLAGLVGWAVSGLFSAIGAGIVWSVTAICDLAVNAYFAIKAFDWNQADADLAATIKANNQAMQSQLARMIGYQAGFGAVRLVSAFAGLVVNRASGGAIKALEGLQIPVLQQRVAIAMAREQGDQLKAQTQAFLQSTAQAQVQNALAWALLMGRKNGLFGLKPVTGPQTDGSINAKIDRLIERLPKDWQASASAALQGLEDGVIGAIYVVAAEADDHLETLRYEKEERRRNQEVLTVEVWPEGADTVNDPPLKYVGLQEDVMEAIDASLPLYDQVSQPRGYLAPPVQIHSVKGNPQVIFCFTETAASQKRRQGKARKEMRASFRILTEKFESEADKAKIEAIALKIRAQFPVTYRHVVGAESWVYTDQKNGFALKISSNSQQEARVLANKLVRCHPDPVAFDNDSFTRGRTKSGVTKRQTVLGKSVVVSGPKERIEVSLRQVDLSLPGWGSQLLVYRQLV